MENPIVLNLHCPLWNKMIDLTFGLNKSGLIIHEILSNVMKPVKSRDISEKQLNWKRRAFLFIAYITSISFLCAFRKFKDLQTKFYSWLEMSLDIGFLKSCETLLTLPDRACSVFDLLLSPMSFAGCPLIVKHFLGDCETFYDHPEYTPCKGQILLRGKLSLLWRSCTLPLMQTHKFTHWKFNLFRSLDILDILLTIEQSIVLSFHYECLTRTNPERPNVRTARSS